MDAFGNLTQVVEPNPGPGLRQLLGHLHQGGHHHPGQLEGRVWADGFNVINATASYASYAAVTPSGNALYTWAASTSDVRAFAEGFFLD